MLETLFLAEDVNSQAEIDEAIAGTEVKKPELALAQQLIDGLRGAFDPKELTSDYRRDLRVLLEAKLRGEEIDGARAGGRSWRPWSTCSMRSRRASRPRRRRAPKAGAEEAESRPSRRRGCRRRLRARRA